MKETKLISSYIVNDKLNIEQVMEDFTPYIYTIIINRKIDIKDEDIEEIISDVFVALWKNQNLLDTSKRLDSYIAGITRNIVSKKFRNLKNITYIDDYKDEIFEVNEMENIFEESDKIKTIMSELNNMKNEDKDIFIYFYYHYKSMKEIAVMLNISEKKVKSRLFRMRKKLKKNLEKRGYSYDR